MMSAQLRPDSPLALVREGRATPFPQGKGGPSKEHQGRALPLPWNSGQAAKSLLLFPPKGL